MAETEIDLDSVIDRLLEGEPLDSASRLLLPLGRATRRRLLRGKRPRSAVSGLGGTTRSL